MVITVAGSGKQSGKKDASPAVNARFNYPLAIAPISDQSYVIADFKNNRLRLWTRQTGMTGCPFHLSAIVNVSCRDGFSDFMF